MTAFKADPRGRSFPNPNGATRFNPTGKIEQCAQGDALIKNPPTWRAAVVYAARIFVGFKVGDEERWSLDDLVKLVRRTRKEKGAPEDSTFLAQRGVYTHRDGRVVDEPGGQVIIFDGGPKEKSESPSVFAGTDPGPETESEQLARFEEEMIALSETIAWSFEQESVILEIQRNGTSVVTMGVAS